MAEPTNQPVRTAFERGLPLVRPQLPLEPSSSRQPDDVLGVGEVSNSSDPPANARLADSETALVFVEEPKTGEEVVEVPYDLWMLIILDGFSSNGTNKWLYSWVQGQADPATGVVSPVPSGIT